MICNKSAMAVAGRDSGNFEPGGGPVVLSFCVDIRMDQFGAEASGDAAAAAAAAVSTAGGWQVIKPHEAYAAAVSVDVSALVDAHAQHVDVVSSIVGAVGMPRLVELR